MFVRTIHCTYRGHTCAPAGYRVVVPAVWAAAPDPPASALLPPPTDRCTAVSSLHAAPPADWQAQERNSTTDMNYLSTRKTMALSGRRAREQNMTKAVCLGFQFGPQSIEHEVKFRKFCSGSLKKIFQWKVDYSFQRISVSSHIRDFLSEHLLLPSKLDILITLFLPHACLSVAVKSSCLYFCKKKKK